MLLLLLLLLALVELERMQQRLLANWRQRRRCALLKKK